jgi:hypothetical protein
MRSGFWIDIVSILSVIATHRLAYRQISIPSISMYRQKSLKHVGSTHVVALGAGVSLLFLCIMKKIIVKALFKTQTENKNRGGDPDKIAIK